MGTILDNETTKGSVLSIGKFYFPRTGGVEIATQEIAEEVARCGTESIVACFDFNQEGEEWINGARIVRFQARMAGPAPFSLGYLWAFPALTRNAAILIFHYPNPIAELSLLLLRRSPKRKVIVFYHSDLIDYHPLIDRLYWAYSRFALRRADIIVTTSEAYPKESPVLQSMRDKIRIIPYATDTDCFNSDPGNLPDEMAPPKIPFERRILFVGRFARFKGLDFLIKALSLLPREYGVVLIGEGSYKSKIANLCNELGLEDRVLMPGEIPNKNLGRWYRACDVFTLPSTLRSESFGIVSLEAMACGLPLVTTELGTGTSLYNKDGVTGRVVPPGNPEALAAAICECYEKRETFGHSAREEVEKKYSLPIFRQNIRDLLSLSEPKQNTHSQATDPFDTGSRAG